MKTGTSILLYRELLAYSNQIKAEIKSKLDGVLYPTALEVPKLGSDQCYVEMYLKLRSMDIAVPPKSHLQSLIPGLEKTCANCSDFFLKRRSQLRKADDILTGVKFELPIRDLLISKGFDAFLANEIHNHLPDLGIRSANGTILVLVEVKYHNAPFILIRSKVNANYECYDSSLTIDSGKFSHQRDMVKEMYPQAHHILLHWVDFPCIKGIFWSSADSVSINIEYERTHRSGDYSEGRKIGHTDKVYHQISHMNDFESLLNFISNNLS